jgi:hypothetical protein
MAAYKYAALLRLNLTNVFDRLYPPGTRVPYSGIYRCRGCGREVASNESEPLPPQNHHQHTIRQGLIRWRLVVYADHRPKLAA